MNIIQELQKEFPNATITDLGHKIYVLDNAIDLVLDLEKNKFTLFNLNSDNVYTETCETGINIKNIKTSLRYLNL